MASESVDKLISSFRTKQEKLRRNYEMVKAFSYGEKDRIISYLPRNNRETESEFRSKPKSISLVTKEVLQKYINGVSALPFTRETNKPIDIDFYYKNLDPVKIQTLLEVAGTLLVKPTIEENEIYFETYLPHEFIPIVNSKTGELKELIINSDDIVEHWTQKTYSTKIDGVSYTFENIYNTIPFVIYRASIVGKDFYSSSDLEAIANENNNINKNLTDLLTLMTDQTFSILTLENYDPPQETTETGEGEPKPAQKELRLDTGGILLLPTGTKLNAVTPDADVNALCDTINKNLARIRREAGTPDFEESGSQSGFALTIKKSTYLEKMAMKRRQFIISDQKLGKLAALMYDTYITNEPRQLDKDFTISTFIETDSLSPYSKEEIIADEKHLLAIGAITPVDILMARYGYSKEEAEKIYLENKKQGQLSQG